MMVINAKLPIIWIQVTTCSSFTRVETKPWTPDLRYYHVGINK